MSNTSNGFKNNKYEEALKNSYSKLGGLGRRIKDFAAIRKGHDIRVEVHDCWKLSIVQALVHGNTDWGNALLRAMPPNSRRYMLMALKAIANKAIHFKTYTDGLARDCYFKMSKRRPTYTVESATDLVDSMAYFVDLEKAEKAERKAAKAAESAASADKPQQVGLFEGSSPADFEIVAGAFYAYAKEVSGDIDSIPRFGRTLAYDFTRWYEAATEHIKAQIEVPSKPAKILKKQF